MDVIDALLPPDERGMTPRDLRALVTVLQATFPTLYPTRLRLVGSNDKNLGPDCWGVTYIGKVKGEPCIVIKLLKTLAWPANFLVLLHEYAHAMTWKPDHQETDDHHSPEWGIAEHRLWTWLNGKAVPL